MGVAPVCCTVTDCPQDARSAASRQITRRDAGLLLIDVFLSSFGVLLAPPACRTLRMMPRENREKRPSLKDGTPLDVPSFAISPLHVPLAAVLDKGSIDVAAVGVFSHSPDIISGDHC